MMSRSALRYFGDMEPIYH